MISTHKTVPSEKGKEILKALEKAVAETLERKRKLGHYAVIWDGEKAIQKGPDAPVSKDQCSKS